MTSLGGQFSGKRPSDSPFTVPAEGKPHTVTHQKFFYRRLSPAPVMIRQRACWDLRGAALIAASGPADQHIRSAFRGVPSPFLSSTLPYLWGFTVWHGIFKRLGRTNLFYCFIFSVIVNATTGFLIIFSLSSTTTHLIQHLLHHPSHLLYCQKSFFLKKTLHLSWNCSLETKSFVFMCL